MLWAKKNDFVAFKIAEIVYWPNNNAFKSSYIHWIYTCGLVLVLLGNFNYIFISAYNGTTFSNLALNLSWLISLFFGAFIVSALKGAHVTGMDVWNTIEFNPQFEYPKKRMQYIIHVHTLMVKIICCYMSVITIAGFVWFEIETCNDDSEENVCGLVFPSYFFVNLSQRPYREIFNLTFLLLEAYIVIGILVSCSYLHLLKMFAEDCLIEFKSILQEAQHIKVKSIRRKKLIKAYKLQQFIKNAWHGVDSIFKWPLLVQYLATGVIAALIFISQLIKFNVLSLGHLAVYTTGTCICGFFGEEMMLLSEQFQQASFYAIPWDGDVETAKFLMFMNLNSNTVFQLSLADYGVYSNELVLVIYQMAYSLVTFYMNVK